jgi:hypothetical protein
MSPDLICPHCLRTIRPTGDVGDPATRCTTCGKPFTRAADGAAPRAMSIRSGMKSRDDDDEDYDEYEDERPSRRGRKRRDERPGKVQAIAIMTLIGGIVATLVGLNWLVLGGLSSMGLCCLWPGGYYSIVIGILAIIKGSQLLGKEGHLLAPPKAIAIMMIINIINADIICTVLGILILVFCGDPEVEDFYQGQR